MSNRWNWMSGVRVLVGVGVGVVLSKALESMVIAVMWGGHGVYLPFIVITAPRELGLYALPIVIGVAMYKARWSRWSVRIVSALQIVSAGIEMSLSNPRGLGELVPIEVNRIWLTGVVALVGYCFVHVGLWLLTRSPRVPVRPAPSIPSSPSEGTSDV